MLAWTYPVTVNCN